MECKYIQVDVRLMRGSYILTFIHIQSSIRIRYNPNTKLNHNIKHGYRFDSPLMK